MLSSATVAPPHQTTKLWRWAYFFFIKLDFNFACIINFKLDWGARTGRARWRWMDAGCCSPEPHDTATTRQIEIFYSRNLGIRAWVSNVVIAVCCPAKRWCGRFRKDITRLVTPGFLLLADENRVFKTRPRATHTRVKFWGAKVQQLSKTSNLDFASKPSQRFSGRGRR